LRPEQLAQGADLHLKVVFLDHQARPDQFEKLRLVTTRSRRSVKATSTSNARAPSVTGAPPLSSRRWRTCNSKSPNFQRPRNLPSSAHGSVKLAIDIVRRLFAPDPAHVVEMDLHFDA